MQTRPPVVAILGHVDHGKTTLLDHIRHTKVAEKEHGGITQSIGAYKIKTGIKGYPTDEITFIDTPGHEAFTKLRARGAEVADIVLLLVDAKDSIKPQTVESISHIKAAKVPFIVVANKIDLPEANQEKVKTDLLKQEVMIEDRGGDVPYVAISAQTGKGVSELLEAILLLSSTQNLTWNAKNPPQAYIIETKKDRRGVAATAIIKDGILHVGDTVFSQDQKTKVRSLTDDMGNQLQEASPSTPFELLGFNELPVVGSTITSTPSEKPIEPQTKVQKPVFSLESLTQPEEGKKLSLIIKADTQGSLETIVASLGSGKNIEIVFAGVGEIHKSDIFLAKTTKAIIIGFNTKPNSDVQDMAKQEKVVIKTYNIIYELIEELTEVSQLIKEKEEREKNVKGEAKILATFVIHNEKVYGVRVTKGKANIGDSAEIYRDKTLFGKTKIVSLKIRAKNEEEVKKDQEAGMMFSPLLDLKVGDVVQFVL